MTELMEMAANPQVWILLVTLASIEIVLGIDNLVFISIAVGKLPLEKREVARKFGIAVACITRIGLLLTLAWLARLTDPLFSLFGRGISVRDLVLILGGLFLIVKGAYEIREQVRNDDHDPGHAGHAAAASFGAVIAQIAVIDIVFSLDSVIAAVGMAGDYVPVMVLAILSAVAVMLLAAGVLVAMRWRINVLSLGDREARLVGAEIRRERTIMVVCATLLTASAVCMSGTIGWLGLVVPHLARLAAGDNNLRTLPLSILAGALFLLCTDTLARNLYEQEIPLGIITGFIGAPFFAWVLVRQKVSD